MGTKMMVMGASFSYSDNKLTATTTSNNSVPLLSENVILVAKKKGEGVLFS